MTTLDLFGLRFVLATGACLAAGLGVWGVTSLCRRLMPALALQRATWLLGQLVIALTFALVLLPQTAPLRMVPAIELADAAPAQVAKASATAVLLPSTASHDGHAWTAAGACVWMAVYLLGFMWFAARLLRAQWALERLAASGVRIDSHHPGFPDGPVPLPVIEVAAAISPMLIGPMAPRLLLPLNLRCAPPLPQKLMIEHELMHWRRGDLYFMTASLVLQTVFWFQPVMRLLRARLMWAQELACDRAVLHGRALNERKVYAAALVGQLRSQCGSQQMALSFGSDSAETLATRIAMMRAPLPAVSKWMRAGALAAIVLVFAGNLALQPALAWPGHSQAPVDCMTMVEASSGVSLVQQGGCGERATPASTFNIVVSLMGFDSGILVDAHTPRLPFEAGYTDWNENWRQATDPSSWITNSTVWYAQQVTAQLGQPRVTHYLADFDYGNQDISGDPGKNNGLQMAWIGSSLQISPDEQVTFLRRIVNRQLPVSAHAYDVTAQLLKLPFETGGWQVYGKTGTASPLVDGKEDTAHAYGWFVGWATKGSRTVVFARLVLEPTQADSSAGPRAKAAFLRDLPARLADL